MRVEGPFKLTQHIIVLSINSTDRGYGGAANNYYERDRDYYRYPMNSYDNKNFRPWDETYRYYTYRNYYQKWFMLYYVMIYYVKLIENTIGLYGNYYFLVKYSSKQHCRQINKLILCFMWINVFDIFISFIFIYSHTSYLFIKLF